ncbi:MAG: hypothetical protein WC790_00320 [Candidatus Paceibacterota bacterium]|jgi:hypothetical protein
MKTTIALFIAALVAAGCSSLPPSGGTYVGTYQEPVGKVCDPTGWWCQPVYAPVQPAQPQKKNDEKPSSNVPAQAPVSSTSTVIYFQSIWSTPPFYYSPSSSSCCWNGNKKWWRW